MKLHIVHKTATKIATTRALSASHAKILKHLETELKKSNKRAHRKLTEAENLTLVFVGQAEMKKLNAQFRQKNKTTDILSFSPVEAHSLGELVFCVPVLKKQAKEHKLSIQDELNYLLLHGILHLLGYDHEINDRAALRMYRLQDSIFEKIRK